MNPKKVLDLLGRLAMLKYFPSQNESVMEGLLLLVGCMCESEAHVEWLVAQMTSGVYAEWPGPQEMRACYCSRFKPKDGINTYSTVYPDGLPASKPLMLTAPQMAALPPGKTASQDAGMEAAVHVLSRANSVLNPLGGPATAEEIRQAPRWLRELEGYR